MISLSFRPVLSVVLSLVQGDIFSSIENDLNKSSSDVVSIALILVGVIGTVYAAFGLRKYLSGDGRGDKEFVKIVTGSAIALILIGAGAFLLGVGGKE